MDHSINLEVCVDNIESIETVNHIEVDRIELCSSLALGGLSPAVSLLNYTNDNIKIPIHAMIRPRPGNFNYSIKEIDNSLKEIDLFSTFKISGIVFGVLTEDNIINMEHCRKIVNHAKTLGLETTFHRAIDLTKNYEDSLIQLIDMNFTRVLTSGNSDNVEKGADRLREIEERYGDKIQIMAGGGVKISNIEMLKTAGLKHIHCSASTLKKDNTRYTLGKNSGDLSYQITDSAVLMEIKKKLIS